MKLTIWPFYPTVLLFAPKKAVLRNLLFIATPLLLMSPSCDDDVATAQISDEYVDIPLTESVCDSLVEKRKTVDRYEDEAGGVQVIEDGAGVRWAFIAPDRMSKYMYTGTIQACNLPDSLALTLTERDRIIFSGILKEVYPTENMPGNPFKLSSLRVKFDKTLRD